MLLYVHRDHKDDYGRAQDGHLDYYTAPELSASVVKHGVPVKISRYRNRHCYYYLNHYKGQKLLLRLKKTKSLLLALKTRVLKSSCDGKRLRSRKPKVVVVVKCCLMSSDVS